MGRSLKAAALAGALAAALGLAAVLPCPPAAAQEGVVEPDLAEATLRLDDLPGEFAETADLFTIRGLVSTLLGRTEGAAVHQHRVYADADTEVAESLLIGPLTAVEQDEFDTWFADEAGMLQVVAQAVPPFDNSAGRAVLDTTGLGDSSFACRITATEEARRAAAAQQVGTPTRLEAVLARRGTYLLVMAVTHDGAGRPLADAVGLARLLDRRLAETLGLPVGNFRPPGLLEPELTTHIPTPIDISTSPAIVGTNLLLAALAMVAFAIASEVLDRILAAHEARLQQVIRPATWLGRVQQRLDSALFTRLGSGRWGDRLRLVGIVALYGLLFSFLQPGWNPFSVTGLYLFVAMTLACAAVGLSGSAAKWATARRLRLPAGLGLRPANLLLAGASTGLSRAFSLVPGLMFGKPEAFQFGGDTPDDPRQGKVLGAGALTLVGVGTAAWLVTIPTALAQRAELPGWLDGAVGAIQTLLLLVFAVAVQGLFIEMLTFPATTGRFLSRRHRLLWVACLVAVTFVFWHTLINPAGRLASALRTANVVFFLSAVTAFVLFAFGLRWYVGRQAGPPAGPR
ncbi:MAG: hypothetical protein H6R33_208, partial [Actinobacteria bacterium]|nr:hypothetical protein [Actinomycetota bacterium]